MRLGFFDATIHITFLLFGCSSQKLAEPLYVSISLLQNGISFIILRWIMQIQIELLRESVTEVLLLDFVHLVSEEL